MKLKRMVCDVSNLFWRAVSAQQRYGPADATDSAGLGLHMSLMSLRKHWNNIKPDKLAIVFEGKQNWRKDYTRSDQCYSKRLYKGNRVSDPSMAVLVEVMKAFEDLARQHTNIVTLMHPKLEGDDLISGYAYHFAAEGDEVAILSGDKDFVQLLGDPLISLINPDDGKPRTLIDVCGIDDAGYFMFEKCFRGDSGDNVLPGLPRVRKTRLQKAYGVNGKPADDFEMNNLMNDSWEHTDPESGDKRMMSVEKMFEENNTLMNLRGQPPEIQALITEVIEHESENHGKFDFFQFQKFLGTYKLQQIAERSTDFVPMFSGKAPSTVAPNSKVKELAERLGGLSF